MANCKVLVLLASYNGELWINEQIESILNQYSVDVSISINDDCSTDNTEKIIRDYCNRDKRVSLVSSHTPSGSAGSNFRRAIINTNIGNSDYIAFADQDDIWNLDKLSSAIRHIESSNCFGYSCSTNAFWDNGNMNVSNLIPDIRAADHLFEGAGQGCTYVICRSLFLDIQSFCKEHFTEIDSFHYHDWLIYLVSRAWSKRWFFDPVPYVQYRQHSNNEIGTRHGFSSFIRRLDLIRNGWYKKQIYLASSIYILCNGSDKTSLRLSSYFLKHKNDSHDFLSRLLLIPILFFHSRRKFSDRIVITISFIFGWL